MNRLSPFKRCGLGLLLGALLAGCTSVDKRIAENKGVFTRLSPEVQQTIRDGHINLGFTPTMVYMALGKPSEINTSADGKEVTWTFMYYNTPDGEVVQTSKVYLGNMTATRSLFQRQPSLPMAPPSNSDAYGTVAGEEDLRRGHVRPPDPLIRDATMRDMMDGPRQDLVIWFVEGAVSGFELVHRI